MGKIMMVSKPTGDEEEGQTEGQIEKSHFYPQHIRYIDTYATTYHVCRRSCLRRNSHIYLTYIIIIILKSDLYIGLPTSKIIPVTTIMMTPTA